MDTVSAWAAPAVGAALLVPLMLALGLLAPVTRATALRLAPLSAMPALALAAFAPAGLVVELPWLLLGTRLGLDATGRIFLVFTALVWTTAGVYAEAYLRGKPKRHTLMAAFLATQAGNLGTCLALDAASFYLAFAVMSFAAYGMVVHERTAEALRAGRVYLVMVVLGEAFLVAAFLLAVGAAGTLMLPELAVGLAVGEHTPIAALFLAGFGIKVGVLLLHVWLPLAHPVAPVPASAVLSGVILKAGLLGWLRFLPLGAVSAAELGTLMLAGGIAAAFYGVAIGLAQRDPKVVLAYSSISQMGFVTMGVGAGLLSPEMWPLLLPAVAWYAAHHALSKSALFLGVGVGRAHGGKPWVLAGLAVPAAALAGAPWTTGAFAKASLKSGLHGVSAPWPVVLDWLLPVAALATSLLMIRLLLIVAGERGEGGRKGLAWRWLISLAAVVLFAAWLGYTHEAEMALLTATWPVGAAILIGTIAWHWRWRAPSIPAGDVLVVAETCVRAARRGLARLAPPAIPVPQVPQPTWTRLESALGGWTVAAGIWLVVLVTLAVVLLIAN